MAGDIVVWVLIGGVVLLVGRRFHRALTGSAGGCGGACCGCRQAAVGDQTSDIEVEQGKMVQVLDMGESQDRNRGAWP